MSAQSADFTVELFRWSMSGSCVFALVWGAITRFSFDRDKSWSVPLRILYVLGWPALVMALFAIIFGGFLLYMAVLWGIPAIPAYWAYRGVHSFAPSGLAIAVGVGVWFVGVLLVQKVYRRLGIDVGNASVESIGEAANGY